MNNLDSKNQKNVKSKKTIESELSELRNEIKKLNNLNVVYKNEIKKKEQDFSRIQEKMKKTLSINASTPGGQSYYKNPNIDIINTLDSKKDYDEKTNLFSQEIQIYNEGKMKLLINQNSILFDILNKVQGFFTNFCKVTNDFISNNNISNSEEIFLDLINIKDNIFSLHLLEEELLDDFYQSFIYNLNKCDDMFKYIFNIRSTNLGSSNDIPQKAKLKNTSQSKLIELKIQILIIKMTFSKILKNGV